MTQLGCQICAARFVLPDLCGQICVVRFVLLEEKLRIRLARILTELITVYGPKLKQKRSKALLLALLNSLADFDGELSNEALALLDELKTRSHRLPPLYADVFVLPDTATCADLVDRIRSLSQEQVAIASYAFQIFHYYEQILRANPGDASPQQKAAYDSQMERVRLSVARSKAALDESLGEKR